MSKRITSLNLKEKPDSCDLTLKYDVWQDAVLIHAVRFTVLWAVGPQSNWIRHYATTYAEALALRASLVDGARYGVYAQDAHGNGVLLDRAKHEHFVAVLERWNPVQAAA